MLEYDEKINCVIFDISPFHWCNTMTFTLTFGLFKGRSTLTLVRFLEVLMGRSLIFRRQVLPLDQSEVCIPDCLSMKNSDLHFLGALLINS